MKLADFKQVFDFPKRRNVVYAFFYVRNGAERPFYVGETSSFTSRMSDYLRASFGAATDFKVSEAIHYLRDKKTSATELVSGSAPIVKVQKGKKRSSRLYAKNMFVY